MGDEQIASKLGARLGHEFVDADLASTALRHRSWCAEHSGAESNERLEFLGDAVLGVVVTDRLFRSLPDTDEGDLARLRSELVNARTLTDIATEIDLGDLLLLGRGEEATDGRTKASILADAMEAALGAVYLDSGLDAAAAVIDLHWGSRSAALISTGPVGDHKSRLQELAARRSMEPPRYTVSESGPEHDKLFEAAVDAGAEMLGRGEGRTKKDAEQEAAAQALAQLLGDDTESVSEVVSDDARSADDEMEQRHE